MPPAIHNTIETTKSQRFELELLEKRSEFLKKDAIVDNGVKIG